VRIIRAEKPDLIQTWMYHADLLGSAASLFAGRPPLVWGIHHTAADRATLNPRTYQTLRLNARLSHSIPTRVICCAESAKSSHVEVGYRADHMTVIPNGVDVNRFQPNPTARIELRAELGLAESDFLIGLCARYHPTKDHATFINAAGMIPNAHFLFCGHDVIESNSALMNMLDSAGIRPRCHMLGPRNDMPRV
jgi:glycosyltransferase involved in cell wall biosynthesis